MPESSSGKGIAMVTGLWVFYDILVGVFFVVYLMDRTLTRRERSVVVALGLAGVLVAIFGWRSESRDADKIDRLTSSNAYMSGQLDSVSKTLGTLASASGIKPNAAPETVTVAALKKIDALQHQVMGLQSAEHRHLTSEQKKSVLTFVSEHPEVLNGLWIMSYPDCFDCRAYAWELAETITAARKDKLTTGVLPYPSNSAQLSTDWRGLIIGARDKDHLTQEQRALVGLLNAAHLNYAFQNISLHVDNSGHAVTLLFIAPSPG
jgi:hypothetical protein